MKSYFKGGSIDVPKQQPIPDADNSAAKNAAAEAKSREKRRSTGGSMNKTLATSPLGTAGAAPTAAPALKSNLG